MQKISAITKLLSKKFLSRNLSQKKKLKKSQRSVQHDVQRNLKLRRVLKMSERKFQRPIMAPAYLDYDGNPIGGIDGPNVTSVNGQSGEVNLDASDVGAKDSSYTPTWAEITGKPTLFSGSYEDLSDKPALFSGSYNDLSDVPSEFPATDESVVTAISSKSQIAALTPIADPTTATSEDIANKLNSIIAALKA